MAKKLVPTEIKTHLIDQVLESVTESANTAYYAFVGDHLTNASTIEEVNTPLETVKTLNPTAYRNMIFGKRISSNDMKFVVDRHNWTANTVYAMYDDEDSSLQSKNFYVVVDEDSYKHVYKCLSNNDGKPSTVKPRFEDAKYDADLFNAGDDYYQTSDGYQWKYMYSIASTIFSKFATQKYIPVTANTTVENNAVEGSIDVVKVTSAGKGYDNYLSGKFISSDFNRIGSNFADYGFTSASTVYKLPAEANQIKNFYQNTMLYLTSGVGAGQYKKIIYSVEIEELNGVFVELESQFSTLPNQTTTYEIFPAVEIVGDGTQSVNAIARAIIDPASSNSVSRVDMLNVGKDYSFATATVLQGDPDVSTGLRPVQVTQASVRPIVSPQGGHGANTALELGARRLSMYMKYSRDEGELVEPTNSFSQFGIIRDPQFANVAIYTSNTVGTFEEDEQVIQFTKLEMAGTFQANSTLGTFIQLDSGSGEFASHFDIGDHVYIKSSDGLEHDILKVATGSNTTAISLDATPVMATGATVNCTAYYVHVLAEGTIKSVSPSLVDGHDGLLINNATPEWKKGKHIYGQTSKTVADIDGVDINNRINSDEADFTFLDFNQMLKIEGNVTSGTFQQDETVTQGTTTAKIHSITENGSKTTLNLTNVTGKFVTNVNIVGGSSEAVLSQTSSDALDLTPGDLDPNTGSIIYLQNDIPVDRNDNQSEEIRVILEF
jgi:hypothetical protein